MAELTPTQILNVLRKQAQDKILAERLKSPEFEKDQAFIDQKVKEDQNYFMDVLRQSAPSKQDQIEIGKSLVRRLDDSARVAGNPFGLGDALESTMTGKTIEESRAKTEEAKQRLGPNMSKVLEVGGEIGASIATAPVGLTTGGAAVFGGGQSLIADTSEKFFKEDRLPTMGEALVATGTGAGLSGFSQFVGNKLARWFTDKGAAKTPLTAGADKMMKLSTARLSKAYELADASDGSVGSAALNDFIVKTLNNPKFKQLGLDPNIDKGVWNGFNVLRSRVGRLEGTQGFSLRELSEIRTMMRDRASRGAARTDAMFEIDRAFSNMIKKSLGNNAAAKRAWDAIDKHEIARMQGEFLANIADKAELSAAGGTKLLDKELQNAFLNLVTTETGRKTMVKLGFSPEQKELFREAAEGTNATVLANKLDRVAGSTWLAPIYRTTLQPLLRARSTATESGNLMNVLGKTFDEPASNMLPSITAGIPQLANPIAPQVVPSVQEMMGVTPNTSAGNVKPAMPASAPPAGSPQRMPRPLTEQPVRSPVSKLPEP